MTSQTQEQERRSHGFAIGLLTGTFVGAGLALWLAPRTASELRERMRESAKGLRQRADDLFEQGGLRVGEVVSELGSKGQEVRDDVVDVVARVAHEVEHYATAAKSDRIAESPIARNVVSRRNA